MRVAGRLVGAALVVGLVAGGARGGAAQRVSAMQDLDQNRFVGTWFEIARYPYKREKACVGNAILVVALADKGNQLQFVNSCDDKKGYVDVRNATARGPKLKVGRSVATGEFKVPSVFPFSTRIWVLGMAPDNSWAVLGSPDHKHLWIFSKTAKLDMDMMRQARQVAGGEGYDVSKLAMTPGVK